MIHCDRCGVKVDDMWQLNQIATVVHLCKDCYDDWHKYCIGESRVRDWMRDNPK